MIGASFWTALGYIALSLLLLVVLLALISALIDVARDPDLGTGSKVGWVVVLILLPVVGLLIYFGVRGRGMRARAGTDSAGNPIVDAPGPR